LDLPRVVELGMRRGVYHLVARLNLSNSSGYVYCSHDWENSYLGGYRSERSGQQFIGSTAGWILIKDSRRNLVTHVASISI
jgi:hypothetical protein